VIAAHVPAPAELRTDRLLLRRWGDQDREPFAALNADAEVMRNMPSLLSRQQSDDFVDRIEARFAERGFGLWAVDAPGLGFIGFVGLWWAAFPAPFAPAMEVGWRLGREAWGHGYATEAAREGLRYGFETVGLDEIVSFTVPQNERSWRVMERIGLVRDPSGDFDHPRVDPIAYPRLVRHVLYGLDAETWRRNHFSE
jgi:RimJ/RimL family protein N-acetyltransferase